MPPRPNRTCARCGTPYHLARHRWGTHYANFCSDACVTAHKVMFGRLHSSGLERRFVELLEDTGLVGVEQFPLGPYIIDLAFPQVRLLVEVDGDAYHSSPRDQARDDREDALAAAKGWRFLRVPQFMIQQHLEEALRTVVEAYVQTTGELGGAD